LRPTILARSNLISNGARLYARGPAPQYQQTIKAQQTGRTMKQRLMAPTTGAPFAMGRAVVLGSSALGMGALCFYGMGLSNQTGALEKSAMWPPYVSERIHTTYAYLTGSLAITAASATLALRSPTIMRMVGSQSMMGMLCCIGAMIGTSMIVHAIPYTGNGLSLKHGAWALHCGTVGAILAPLSAFGGPMILRAAFMTAGIVFGLSTIAVCAPSEKFLNWAGPLSMGLGVVFVSNIAALWFPPTSALGAGLHSIVIYGGLVLFSAFLLFNTQRIIKKAEVTPYYGKQARGEAVYFDPINAQMGVYMDIINIFIRLLMIMGGGNKKR